MSEPAKVIEGDVEPKAKAVAKRKIEMVPAAPLPVDADPMLATLNAILMNPTLPMERVNQAMDFYQRLDADKACKAFNAAMADAKAKFGPIVKRHLVEYGEGSKKTSYKHEDLADIAEVVDPAMGECGLFCRWRCTSNLNEPISVTCIVSHRLGHSEEVTLRAGSDSSGGKNSIQAMASTVTYLQRYTQRLALGLATTRGDDDGRSAGAAPKTTITDEQASQLSALVGKTDAPTEIGKIILQQCKVEKFSDIEAERFGKIKKWLKDKFEVE